MLDNCFARAGTLAATIGASYQEQMVTQLYKLFFSIELLGNPRGLFTKMATGVTDAFYEPMAGLVRGPEEFAHGVLRGGKSLVDNVVVGVTDSIGKITGSLAKGVAELSMDNVGFLPEQYTAEDGKGFYVRLNPDGTPTEESKIKIVSPEEAAAGGLDLSGRPGND